MCGIGGFSLAEGSKINSRKLANVMLSELEVRGGMASGVAWHSSTGVGYIKNNVTGSKLNLRGMPKKADCVILHTRLATHGSPTDNRNNHPVLSPSNSLRVVHNGVIHNHDILRGEIDAKLPPVDSSVIPALLESESLSGISKLDGDASIAWLDDDDYGTLRIARINHSPLVITQVDDGSFLFASTEAIMNRIVKRMGFRIVFWNNLAERTGYAVRSGRIIETLAIPSLDPDYALYVDYKTKSSLRHQTAGGTSVWSDSDSVWDPAYANPYASSWWDDGDDLTPAQYDAMSEVEEDFEYFLCDYIEVNTNEFFNEDGYYVGDRQHLYELFERQRYKNWLREHA